MTLYSDAVDPVGHTVRFILAEKDVVANIHYVLENDKPEDLLELNPYGSILTLIDRDLVLYDARIIMEYLDERYPHPPLMPVDPVSRAKNRQLRYRIWRDLYGYIDSLNNSNEIESANARKCVRDNLTVIAPLFKQHRYFMSDEFTLVDCLMAPFLWRLDKFGISIPKQAQPLLDYEKNIIERKPFLMSLSMEEREMRH